MRPIFLQRLHQSGPHPFFFQCLRGNFRTRDLILGMTKFGKSTDTRCAPLALDDVSTSLRLRIGSSPGVALRPSGLPDPQSTASSAHRPLESPFFCFASKACFQQFARALSDDLDGNDAPDAARLAQRDL